MSTFTLSFRKMLRNFVIIGLLFMAVGYTSNANAAQGCGIGFHRNFWGACVYNYYGPAWGLGWGWGWAPYRYYYNSRCYNTAIGSYRCYRY